MARYLKAISTYEKKPPEIIKDGFAYDRLLEAFRDAGREGLKMPKKAKAR